MNLQTGREKSTKTPSQLLTSNYDVKFLNFFLQKVVEAKDALVIAVKRKNKKKNHLQFSYQWQRTQVKQFFEVPYNLFMQFSRFNMIVHEIRKVYFYTCVSIAVETYEVPIESDEELVFPDDCFRVL